MAGTPSNSNSTNTTSNYSPSPYNINQNTDPNSIFYQGAEAGAPDPFELNPIYNSATGLAAPQTEQQSPGYQAYGQDWVNLVNALGNPDEVRNASAEQALIGYGGLANGTGSYGWNPNVPVSQTLGYVNYNRDFPLSPGSSIFNSVTNPNAQLDPSGSASQYKTQIAQALGLDPNSPDAANYANAYVTYANQLQGRNNLKAGVDQERRSGSFESILGDIVGALATSVAAGPAGVLGGAISAAGSAAEAGAEASAEAGAEAGAGGAFGATSSLEDFLKAITSIGPDTSTPGASLFNTASRVLQSAPGLATGNPLEFASGVAGGLGGDAGRALQGGINLGEGAIGGNPFQSAGGFLDLLSSGNNLVSGPSGGGVSGNNNSTNVSGNYGTDNVTGSSSGINPATGTPYEQENISGNTIPNISGTLNYLPNASGTSGGNNISGTNGSNNIPGQSQGSPFGMVASLGNQAAGLGNLIQGLTGSSQGTPTGNLTYGTNIIQTPVSAAEAASVSNSGNWTDRQLYDLQQAIQQRVISGQITAEQGQQELQATIGQQTQ